jgi:hypothetical protein
MDIEQQQEQERIVNVRKWAIDHARTMTNEHDPVFRAERMVKTATILEEYVLGKPPAA